LREDVKFSIPADEPFELKGEQIMRHAIILMMASLFASTLCTQFACQAGPQNPADSGEAIVSQQLANPGFEQGAVGQQPAEWLVPKIDGYEATISDETPATGQQCATIVCTSEWGRGPFGNLMQLVNAEPFRGKRVRLRAAVRAEVTGKGNHANMWFRVDRRDQEGSRLVGAFDNMFQRPITNNEWDHYEIVGDVDDDAENIAIGVFLAGAGQAWIDDVSLEVVGEDVPATTWRPGGGRKPLKIAEPGLFEIVSAIRLTPNRLPLTSLSGMMDSIRGAPIPPQTVLMPLPLSYRDQVPIGFHLTVDPPGAVQSAEIYQDRRMNYVLKLIVEDLRKLQQVDITFTSTILVGPSAFDDVPTAAPLPDAWPEEAQPWLSATWCADSENDRIQSLAAEIRAESDNVREIISHVEKKSGQIFRSAEGQVWNLTAVEALDKRGSCTSCANLVAALLRATGVPARILSGYPSWSGPLQTHYIVEAYVPGYGWYPIEATMSQSPWPNIQQVNVAIIPPEYEAQEKAGMRSGIAGGVPYLSLTEMPENSDVVVAQGMVDSERDCDHECRMIRSLTGAPDEWEQALAWARPRWQEWLAAKHEKSHGQLRFGRKSGDIAATSVTALSAELEP
jgi:Transglutaminase-like superfamily